MAQNGLGAGFLGDLPGIGQQNTEETRK